MNYMYTIICYLDDMKIIYFLFIFNWNNTYTGTHN